MDENSGTYYLVETLQSTEIIVTANKPHTFSQITITRSEEEVSTSTDLTVCITPSNPVPSNSKLTIVYPIDQTVVTSGQQTYTSNANGFQILQVVAFESQKATIRLDGEITEGE